MHAWHDSLSELSREHVGAPQCSELQLIKNHTTVTRNLAARSVYKLYSTSLNKADTLSEWSWDPAMQKQVQTINRYAPNSIVKLIGVLDGYANMQALCALRARENDMFLDAIVTAPHNLPLETFLKPTSHNLRAKDAGKFLVGFAYLESLRANKPWLWTDPLPEVTSFYASCGMSPSCHTSHYEIPITHAFPRQLQAELAILTEGIDR